MSKSAIILGATGLTGGLLLQNLLKDERYTSVILFSRNSCNIKHPKLTENIVDLFELEKHQDKFKADEVFCCIGTTKSKTSDKETYKKIDYGIPVVAASLCKQNNIETFAVISALGAKKNSAVFYNKIKGKMEEAVLDFKVKHTYILQPSLITGERDEKRLGESVMKFVFKLIKPLMQVGELQRYRPIHPETIANCMVWLTNHKYESGRIESNTIQEIEDKK